ncbi:MULTISPECIES: hypothetical protein [unclassified Streptomyces]|uniref:hypothetical protein n=1 Tax=unclassified Streptomyces TaxID=2593676 RepID=UPI0001C1C029|nr:MULTISPECIES: hypothetical protein [unclassified Streptomyces]AEN10018.1 hypothetical protein SACTE_2119 [Streptomyces sp. SirexAA-E]MYR67119.1 hypothetical protein [Streptomyces sp. SID4939]MYS03953.1 hypothetical protein [Streptomyces sp. SID4940]MYT66196.1 hypothetical protein [Streptomyces sp. SID8357]MYT88258.1 hypothetical protein [Streptomyces sp. SID8360]
MTEWMHHAPRWTVISVCIIAAVLLFVGAFAHVTDLLSHGLHSYDWAPGWLNLYWSSLALFDALAGVLLIYGKRRGTDLACVIMATDLAPTGTRSMASSTATSPLSPAFNDWRSSPHSSWERRRSFDDTSPIETSSYWLGAASDKVRPV